MCDLDLSSDFHISQMRKLIVGNRELYLQAKLLPSLFSRLQYESCGFNLHNTPYYPAPAQFRLSNEFLELEGHRSIVPPRGLFKQSESRRGQRVGHRPPDAPEMWPLVSSVLPTAFHCLN
jgi:hypothetical protein